MPYSRITMGIDHRKRKRSHIRRKTRQPAMKIE
jgi:hypothetical protein